ncbi:hypothetical protein EDC01DRAFT_193999 [Geopyxis carbonaria]|nr:hypothetical protein EDC01DRAFT_193999 [Geopyxis carbonaria]
MPLIQDLSADDDAAPAADSDSETQASVALDTCLHILANESQPLEQQYIDILAQLPPLESHLSTAPDVTSLQPRLLALLRPHAGLAPAEVYTDDDDTTPAPLPAALPGYHALSTKLLNLLHTTPLDANADLAATLAALTSPDDVWTTPESRQLAATLLADTPALSTAAVQLSVLAALKPLFASATPSSSTARVTATGRLAVRAHTNPDTALTPVWKSRAPAAPAVLAHVLSALPADALEDAWPLLLPPVLTLCDSTDVAIRTRAITLVTALLSRLEEAGSTLLLRTGLAEVVWDAVLPALHYLPPLTPTAQAVPLLRAAFGALRRLARAREPRERRKRAALLGVCIADGVVRGVQFAGENVAVAQVLIEALDGVLGDMGIWAVRHLRDVTTLLSDILANPFGGTCPELLLAALRAEQTLLRVCWPRAGTHAAELLRGLALCWGRIGDDGREEGDAEVVEELRRTVQMLGAVVGNMSGGKERWGALTEGIEKVDGEAFGGLFVVSDGV